MQHARKVALDEVAFENAARGVKRSKIPSFSRCNEGTIDDGAVNNPTDCHVIETISVKKFPQVQGSLQLTRKVSLDQIAHENEATGIKSSIMPAIRRCNKGTIVDLHVNNPNRTGWNACNINYREIHGSL